MLADARTQLRWVLETEGQVFLRALKFSQTHLKNHYFE